MNSGLMRVRLGCPQICIFLGRGRSPTTECRARRRPACDLTGAMNNARRKRLRVAESSTAAPGGDDRLLGDVFDRDLKNPFAILPGAFRQKV